MSAYDSGAAWSRGILQCHSQVLQWQECWERPNPVRSDGGDTLPMHVRHEGFPAGVCCWPTRAHVSLKRSLGSWHGALTWLNFVRALHPGECKHSSGVPQQNAGCRNPGMERRLYWLCLPAATGVADRGMSEACLSSSRLQVLYIIIRQNE